jgi:hypothetical protein
VYVTNKPTSAQQPASILGYSISDNTGALTAVPGSPFQILEMCCSTFPLDAPSAVSINDVVDDQRGRGIGGAIDIGAVAEGSVPLAKLQV